MLFTVTPYSLIDMSSAAWTLHNLENGCHITNFEERPSFDFEGQEEAAVKEAWARFQNSQSRSTPDAKRTLSAGDIVCLSSSKNDRLWYMFTYDGFEEISEPDETIECGQCEGTGTIEGGLGGDGDDEECPVCDGSGEIIHPNFA